MKHNAKSIGTMALAAGGSAFGGYSIGSQLDAKRTKKATSAIGSYGVILPLVIGAIGYLALRKKNNNAAMGLAAGGVAGAAFGFYKFGTPAAAPANGSSVASNGAGGSGSSGGQGGSGTGGGGQLSGAGYAGSGSGGYGSGGGGTALSAMPGKGRRRTRRMGSMAGVRRALNSPTGSGLGDMLLPSRFQTGGGAFQKDAWSR